MLRAAPAAIEPALAELLNALVEHAENITLILDDYHLITTSAIHEGITIARETLSRVRDRVAGVQVSAPLGRVDLAIEVFDSVIPSVARDLGV